MHDATFKLDKLPQLSDTVYLETLNSIMLSVDNGETEKCAELCMEGVQLCIEAGLWHPDLADRCEVGDLVRYLAHLHLDAQVKEIK